MAPAIPFYALAAASLLAATVTMAVERVDAGRLRKVMNALTLLLCASALTLCFWPGLDRDRGRLASLDSMAPIVPRGAILGICPGANGEWGLHAWFQRRFEISLDAASGGAREWFLGVAGRGAPDCPPPSCTAVTESLRELVLFKCARSSDGVKR